MTQRTCEDMDFCQLPFEQQVLLVYFRSIAAKQDSAQCKQQEHFPREIKFKIFLQLPLDPNPHPLRLESSAPVSLALLALQQTVIKQQAKSIKTF